MGRRSFSWKFKGKVEGEKQELQRVKIKSDITLLETQTLLKHEAMAGKA